MSPAAYRSPETSATVMKMRRGMNRKVSGKPRSASSRQRMVYNLNSTDALCITQPTFATCEQALHAAWPALVEAGHCDELADSRCRHRSFCHRHHQHLG